MPSGVGFCLYITRAGMEAVGQLSEIYSRGYYEDVDFCLKAHEMGLRKRLRDGRLRRPRRDALVSGRKAPSRRSQPRYPQ